MRKSLIAAAAAASIGLASLVAPAPAKAGCFGCAVGAGIFGGVLAGAIVGSAIANSPPPPAASAWLLSAATGNLLPARGRLSAAGRKSAAGRLCPIGTRLPLGAPPRVG